MSASLRVPSEPQRITELRFSYCRDTCCGPRERTIASFTFPKGGWRRLHDGMFVNNSVGAKSVRLDRLNRKDVCQPVMVSGLAGGMSIFRSSLLLRDLLTALTSPRGGCVSQLDFSLKAVRYHVGGGLPPSEFLGRQCSSPGPMYALYCNGRLCRATVPAERGLQNSEVLQGSDTTYLDIKMSQHTTHNIPAVGVPRVKGDSNIFQARVIVHRVDDIVQFGELFPDVYVKARMKELPSQWCRTDVHKKCVNSTALFEYRLVLPPFTYPARPVRRGLCRRLRRLPPTLEIVVMDEDQVTRDDKVGDVRLSLDCLMLPDDRESCSVATLSNECVNLFNPAELRRVRSKNAVFPRELTGYWPLLKKKKFNRELKTVGSVRLTLQLLTAGEAAAFPAAPGNRAWPANRYPRLTRPHREHGRIRDKVVFGFIQNVEQVIAHATGIPNLKMFIVVAAVIAVMVMHIRMRHVKAISMAVYHNARHYVLHYPDEIKFILFFYVVSCVAWVYMQRGFGSPKKQQPGSSLQ